MNDHKIKELTEAGLMTALVFAGITFFKIPNPFNGYSHLGDSFIFLSVLILGKKRGAMASGVGGALADLLGGFGQWALPTFIIKAGMAYILGMTMERQKTATNISWIPGAILGSIFQVFGYTLSKLLMYGDKAALATLPNVILQSGFGIVMAFILLLAMKKTPVGKRIFS